MTPESQAFGNVFRYDEPSQLPVPNTQPQQDEPDIHLPVRRALGEHLVQGGFLTNLQLQAALQDQFCSVDPTAKRLGEILVRYGWVSGRVIDFFLRYRSHRLIQPGKPLGDYLLDLSLISPEDLTKALRLQKTSYQGQPLGKILVKFGLVKQQTIDYLINSVIKPELLSMAQKQIGESGSDRESTPVSFEQAAEEDIYYDELTPFSQAFSTFKKHPQQ